LTAAAVRVVVARAEAARLAGHGAARVVARAQAATEAATGPVVVRTEATGLWRRSLWG